MMNFFKEQRFDLIQYATPNAALYASLAGKLVRANPINPLPKEEIDGVCVAGADIIMFPMVEMPQTMARFDDILAGDGEDELYIMLNELHIGLV